MVNSLMTQFSYCKHSAELLIAFLIQFPKYSVPNPKHALNHSIEIGWITGSKMKKKNEELKLTKNDAKCSEVITALNPTTGTNEANNVPNTTCIKELN